MAEGSKGFRQPVAAHAYLHSASLGTWLMGCFLSGSAGNPFVFAVYYF